MDTWYISKAAAIGHNAGFDMKSRRKREIKGDTQVSGLIIQYLIAPLTEMRKNRERPIFVGGGVQSGNL